MNSFLITGAGSGIGKACAIYLAERGTRVFAAGRTMAKLEALSHDNIVPVQMDITDEASIHNARGQIKAHLNGAALTGLVNNAGISMMGPTALVSNEDWHRQFETNVFGAMNVIRAFLPEMIAARAGRIVTIGSVTGRLAPPFMGVYAASKHAVEGFSDALRREVAPFGVKVSVVRPGFVRTEFGDQEQAELSRYTDQAPYAERLKTFAAWHKAKGHDVSPGPEIVAQAVYHALTHARPKTRYQMPFNAKFNIFARSFLPVSIVDRMIAKVTGT